MTKFLITLLSVFPLPYCLLAITLEQVQERHARPPGADAGQRRHVWLVGLLAHAHALNPFAREHDSQIEFRILLIIVCSLLFVTHGIFQRNDSKRPMHATRRLHV